MKHSKKKILKNYNFEGLGFSVVLRTVELQKHGDDYYPVINSRKLQDNVFDFFIDHPVRITGTQLSFIRKYMQMTQEQFAKALDLTSHARVSQWERSKDAVADIRPVYLAALRVLMAKCRGRKTIDIQSFTKMVEGQLDDPKPIKLTAA